MKCEHRTRLDGKCTTCGHYDPVAAAAVWNPLQLALQDASEANERAERVRREADQRRDAIIRACDVGMAQLDALHHQEQDKRAQHRAAVAKARDIEGARAVRTQKAKAREERARKAIEGIKRRENLSIRRIAERTGYSRQLVAKILGRTRSSTRR